jgi:hypothetical protein
MASGAVERASTSAQRSADPGALERLKRAAVCYFFAGASLACGGAAALLHPAQTLPVDTVSVGAGVSGQFASSDVQDTIDRGRSAAGQPLTDPATANAYASGVLAEVLLAPGASPWVGARVGLPSNTEAGLTYTGRSLRLDGRYALELDDAWTLSLGLGASGLLLTPERSPPSFDPAQPAPSNSQAEFDPTARGWGADLPVLIGYRMLEGFGDLWLGPRFGFEHLAGNLRLVSSDPGSLRIDIQGTRLWGALVAGFSLGIPPLWLRFELSAAYQRLSGTLKPAEPDSGVHFDGLEATGWTFSPSGAIVGKF